MLVFTRNFLLKPEPTHKPNFDSFHFIEFTYFYNKFKLIEYKQNNKSLL